MIPLSDLLADHQEFHSDLQMDAFITQRNGGTLYGCYKQALREVVTRIRALRDRHFGIKRLKRQIEEHRAKGTPQDLDDATEKEMSLAEVEFAHEHAKREFVRFYGQAASIQEAMKSQGIEFPLSEKTRHRLDCEMWVHQLKCRAAIAALSCHNLDNITIELIQSLPLDLRHEVCDAVFVQENCGKLIDWFMEFNIEIPAPKKIEVEPMKLIGCSE